jgi:MFS family permease
VADLALPDERGDERGTAFGWFHLITEVALLPASLLFGRLYETFNPSFAFMIAFTIAAAVALAAAALLALTPLPITAALEADVIRKPDRDPAVDGPAGER